MANKDQVVDMMSFSVGNPALGLSDAIVGSYGHGRGCDCNDGGSSGGGANTGGGGNSGSSDDSGSGVVEELIKISNGYVIGKVIDKVVDKIGKGGCCCGGGTGFLIEESEIVL